MKKFSILIVEDELLVADNITQVLETEGYEVCGVADNIDDANELFIEHRPHLVICDVKIKGRADGTEVAQLLLNIRVVPVLYLSAFTDEATLAKASTSMPMAYIIKPFVEKQLTVAVKMALQKFYGAEAQSDVQVDPPSNRELVILKLVAEGKKAGEIAEQLNISVHTAYTHRRNLLARYNVNNSSELIALASKMKWL